MSRLTAILLTAVALSLAQTANAQTTVGELLEKGGKQLSKADLLDMMPMRYQGKWPNNQGEEELFFTEDGKISGSGYHYGSRSSSPATGQWTVEDDGKFCTPKTFSAWNSSTNLCWYIYQSGDAYFGTQKTDAGSRLGKINSIGKASK
jgi:hypothetical protein